MTQAPQNPDELFGTSATQPQANPAQETKPAPAKPTAKPAPMPTVEKTASMPGVTNVLTTPLPEAKGIAWVDLYETFVDDQGQIKYARWNLTERSSLGAVDAFETLRGNLQERFNMGAGDLSMYPTFDIPARQQEHSTTQKVAAGAGFGKAANEAFGGGNNQEQGQEKSDDSGTTVLNKIVIAPPDENGKQKVEFYVGQFRYPFNEYRGATVVSKLFEESMGITPQMMSKPRVWTPKDWAGFGKLMVEWEHVSKNGKSYRNVLKVRPAMPGE